MEHRRYPRFARRLQVAVYHRARYLGRYDAHEISVDGMCLRQGPVPLTPYEIVELRILDDPRGGMLIGMVIHTGQGGIGIMFDDAGRQIVDRFLAEGTPDAAA